MTLRGKKDEVQQLREEGWTYQKLAEKYQVTKQAVHYFCVYNGLSSLKPGGLNKASLYELSRAEHKLTLKDKMALLENITNRQIADYFLYLSGFSLRDIAVRQQCCLDDVEDNIRKMTNISKHTEMVAVIQEIFS
jgi:predicted DNA-binding protein YlxM (UPF0122 family)